LSFFIVELSIAVFIMLSEHLLSNVTWRAVAFFITSIGRLGQRGRRRQACADQ
jgi:hypothetical protein